MNEKVYGVFFQLYLNFVDFTWILEFTDFILHTDVIKLIFHMDFKCLFNNFNTKKNESEWFRAMKFFYFRSKAPKGVQKTSTILLLLASGVDIFPCLSMLCVYVVGEVMNQIRNRFFDSSTHATHIFCCSSFSITSGFQFSSDELEIDSTTSR